MLEKPLIPRVSRVCCALLNEGVWSDLVIVSGDQELVGLSLDLLVPLQSDDCRHSGEHWDICSQQSHTDTETTAQIFTAFT